MTTNIEIDLLPLAEVAQLVGVTVAAVRQRIVAGKLRGIRANGRCWLVPRAEVEKWTRERKENFR
jgi:excisionase family DNA binding protein